MFGLKVQAQSLSFVRVFVIWKSIFFLTTFEEFGVNSLGKSISTTRLKSKTFALQLSRPKIIQIFYKTSCSKACFTDFSLPFLFLSIFLISSFYLTVNKYVFEYSNFPNIMSPEITIKPAVKTTACQPECKSHKLWWFLALQSWPHPSWYRIKEIYKSIFVILETSARNQEKIQKTIT